MSPGAAPRRGVITRTFVGSVELPVPVLTASGTAGHGTELDRYVELDRLGAVVVKSLTAGAWAGNPAPRLVPTPAGMLNAVGLQGPGVAAWREAELPRLVARGARVVASIWGRTIEEFAEAAAELAGAPGVVAVEVNVSCPNLHDRRRMFAHCATATADAVAAAAASGLPRWVKLSPNVADLVEIADAALGAGADALVLVNTVLGMAIDVERTRYALGSGPAGGGLSGPAIRPVAVRAIHDCRTAFPEAAIIGVGGVARGVHAVELLMAGANAVEVGTATFYDPRAPRRVADELVSWCKRHRVTDVRDLVGAVHRGRSQGTDAAAGVAEGPSEPVDTASGSPAGSPAPAMASGTGGEEDRAADQAAGLVSAMEAQIRQQASEVATLTDVVASLRAALAERHAAAAGEPPDPRSDTANEEL